MVLVVFHDFTSFTTITPRIDNLIVATDTDDFTVIGTTMTFDTFGFKVYVLDIESKGAFELGFMG